MPAGGGEIKTEEVFRFKIGGMTFLIRTIKSREKKITNKGKRREDCQSSVLEKESGWELFVQEEGLECG